MCLNEQTSHFLLIFSEFTAAALLVYPKVWHISSNFLSSSLQVSFIIKHNISTVTIVLQSNANNYQLGWWILEEMFYPSLRNVHIVSLMLLGYFSGK
jgi:hypothetical protein